MKKNSLVYEQTCIFSEKIGKNGTHDMEYKLPLFKKRENILHFHNAIIIYYNIIIMDYDKRKTGKILICRSF